MVDSKWQIARIRQQPEAVATYHQHQLKPATGALVASLTEALPVLLPG